MQNKKTFHGGSMDIFWNCTMFELKFIHWNWTKLVVLFYNAVCVFTVFPRGNKF